MSFTLTGVTSPTDSPVRFKRSLSLLAGSIVMSRTLSPVLAWPRALDVARVVFPTPPVPQKISNDLVIILTWEFYMSFEREPTKSNSTDLEFVPREWDRMHCISD